MTGFNTLAERDAIIVERREWGMVVSLSNGIKWELVKGYVSQDLADNANWRAFSVSDAGDSFDATEILERIDTLESDLTDAENAVIDLENLQDKYVLKVVGKQLSDQNFTLEEKQKLAGLQNFTGAVGDTITDFQLQGNTLTISTDKGTKAVDLSDFVPTQDGSPIIQAAPSLQALSGTLNAQFQGVIPVGAKAVISLVVENGYSYMKHEYSLDLAASTFTITTHTEDLQAGDRYEVWAVMTHETSGGSTGGGGTPQPDSITEDMLNQEVRNKLNDTSIFRDLNFEIFNAALGQIFVSEQYTGSRYGGYYGAYSGSNVSNLKISADGIVLFDGDPGNGFPGVTLSNDTVYRFEATATDSYGYFNIFN